MSKQSKTDIESFRQIWESDEMWKLRRSFLETYFDDERFTKNRLLCLSQILINIEFLGCTYNEKLMAQVGEMADEMVKSRRERRRTVVEKVFVRPKEEFSASSSTLMRNEEKSNLKRKLNETEPPSEVPRKKLANSNPEMVDLGGGFWRQVPSQDTPIVETKLKSMQLLKAQLSIAPTELRPLELLNYACNRCKFDWSIDFDSQASTCCLKIEKVTVVVQKFWGDEQRSRVAACKKANTVLQRILLDVRQSPEDHSQFLLYTTTDARKFWESPADQVFEPLAAVLRSLRRRFGQKGDSKWRTIACESLQNACKAEGVPFELKRVHMGGWREDIQVHICRSKMFSQQQKAAPKGKEIDSNNEICGKFLDYLLKQTENFKIRQDADGNLQFYDDSQDDAQVASASKNGAPIDFDVKLKVLKHHLMSIDNNLNPVTRLDQACNKAKVAYESEMTGQSPPFQCTITIAGAFAACESDTSKKGAKQKACESTVNLLEKMYTKVLIRNNRLSICSSNEPDSIEIGADEIKKEPDSNKAGIDFVILRNNLEQTSKSLLYNSASFNRAAVKFEEIETNNKSKNYKTAVFLNGCQLARGHGSSKKDAEESAAKTAMDKLMRTHHTIFIKAGVDPYQNEIDIESNNQKQETNLVGEGFGAKLMAKMGWTGGGMGAQEQGIKKPIELMECFQRRGLGSMVDKNFCSAIRTILQDYLDSNKLDDLVFSVALSSDQRKFIHQTAARLHLKSKSYSSESESERQLTIQKRHRPMELLNYLLKIGGENGKYKVILPTNSC